MASYQILDICPDIEDQWCVIVSFTTPSVVSRDAAMRMAVAVLFDGDLLPGIHVPEGDRLYFRDSAGNWCGSVRVIRAD